jgi:hypothetical protein
MSPAARLQKKERGMRVSTLASIVCLALVGVVLTAQEQPAVTRGESVRGDVPTVSEVAGVSGEELPPDYSKKALLSAFWTDPLYEDDVPRAPETFNPFRFVLFGQTFQFNPFLAWPGQTYTSASPFDVVDPFSLAPVSPAYTPHTFRDRWRDWKLNRQLNESKGGK